MKRKVALLVIDLALIAAATVLALALRDNLAIDAERLQALLPYLGLTIAIAAPVLMVFGLNRAIWRLSGLADYLHVLFAVVLIVSAAVVAGFVLSRLEGIARSLPIIQGVLMVFLMVGVRVLARVLHRRRRERNSRHGATSKAASVDPSNMTGARETILVAGMGPITELYLQSIGEFTPDQVAVAGVLGRSESHTGRLLQRYPILGTPEDVDRVVRELEVHGVIVDRIIVTAPFERFRPEAREALLDIAKSSSIRLEMFADRFLFGNGTQTGPKSSTGGSPRPADPSLTYLAANRDIGPVGRYWQLKRLIDLTLACALIVLLSPVIVLSIALVMIDVGLPLTFWQQRPGLRGRPFRLYKFRTMRSAYDADGHHLTDDQRQSCIGRFLRRTRLDELPQLHNILIGEMSFVGPRPLLQMDQPIAARARLSIRPGLTGWAQVNGGKTVAPDDKMALDLWYVRHASVALDLRILLQTARMVVAGEALNPTAVRLAWAFLGRARDAEQSQSDDNLVVLAHHRAI